MVKAVSRSKCKLSAEPVFQDFSTVPSENSVENLFNFNTIVNLENKDSSATLDRMLLSFQKASSSCFDK